MTASVQPLRRGLRPLNSAEDTLNCGRFLGQLGPCSGMIFLQGELGAGKTTLARGMLRGMGFGGIVCSPSYTLLEIYPLGSFRVCHLDLYRLNGAEELEDIGFRELHDGRSLCLVEWPERGGTMVTSPDLLLHLHFSESGRTLEWLLYNRQLDGWADVLGGADEQTGTI